MVDDCLQSRDDPVQQALEDIVVRYDRCEPLALVGDGLVLLKRLQGLRDLVNELIRRFVLVPMCVHIVQPNRLLDVRILLRSDGCPAGFFVRVRVLRALLPLISLRCLSAGGHTFVVE